MTPIITSATPTRAATIAAVFVGKNNINKPIIIEIIPLNPTPRRSFSKSVNITLPPKNIL